MSMETVEVGNSKGDIMLYHFDKVFSTSCAQKVIFE